MKVIGIIQPGKLGDIIICLPIAKHYADLGYKVIWPIFDTFVSMLNEVIDYVTFIPVTSNVYDCVSQSKNVLQKLSVDHIFDIAATFPDSVCTNEYVVLGDGLTHLKFDYFKYNKCHVPFEKKWNLEFKRNLKQEDEIIKDLTTSQKYDIKSTKHSRGNLSIQFQTKNQLIEVNENYNLFSWFKILQQAECIALVDSAMANFVEQTNMSNRKILLQKPGHPTPTFKNNWIIKNT